MKSEMQNKTTPGIKTGLELKMFNPEELSIIQLFARKQWYITRVEDVNIANGRYKVVLAKPTMAISECFNIYREVVILFSPYESFEARCIDAIDYLDVQELRLEEICSIVISNDKNIEQAVNRILKVNQESRIIVPFSYEELLNNGSDEYIMEKLRSKFYCRDLFGIHDPLKKDLYFFGRKEMIHEIVNKHLNAENAGIFGLRKTGKTSILYGVERALNRKRSISVFIDCQTLHLKSWNIALGSIIELVRERSNVKKSCIHTLEDYKSIDFVSDYFYADIKNIYARNDKKSILLIFDEVEHITFDTSISSSWRNGESFVKFWQVLRSTYQRLYAENVFTYLVAGTNPRCIELPSISNVDNPIFAQFKPIFIEPFDYSMTKEMLDKLGGYMGMNFSNETCTHIVEDFGGHPLLMRQICSYIHTKLSTKRPVAIDKHTYQKNKDAFNTYENGFIKYAQMILEVLSKWYPDEYQMLTWMALGDYDTFNGLAKDSPEYVTHLIKYGIIAPFEDEYVFKIEALQKYLQSINKYSKLHLTTAEKQEEISQRRNAIEPKLRNFVRLHLKAKYGEEIAKQKVITMLYGSKEVSRKAMLPYKQFFDPLAHKIYLSHLFELIRLNYDAFENLFRENVEIFNSKTKLINHYRKPDAHAAEISDSDFNMFRGAIEWLESVLEENS